MAIVTATQVAAFTDISTGVTAISASGLIPIVQSRINQITNNYFISDMQIQGGFTFVASNSTILCGTNFATEGFIASDEVYIYNSYRNDGYKAVSSVTTTTLTLTDTVIEEPSGRSVLIAVVQWPSELAYIAAQMIKYDYDDRPNQEANVKSKTLGPYSVSYGGISQSNSFYYGYPDDLIAGLSSYTIARLN